MDARIQILLALVLLTSSIQPLPTGAPPNACSNLDPSLGHGPSNKEGSAPYEVRFSAEEYTPGNPVEVTLSGLDGEMFKGFLIQGFPADGSSTEAVGTFEIPDGAVYKAVCQSRMGNGVTHKDNNKKSKVILKWTAPKDTRQDIVFHYTVVRGNSGLSDYFRDQKSAVLKAASPSPNSHFQKDPECGKTKGCYGNCKANNSCNWLVTWQQEGPTKVRLILTSVFTSDNKYVAVGFSEQDKMAKASVLSCRLHNGIVDVIGSTNPEYSNKPLNNVTEGLSDIQVSHINSLLQCSFLREMTSSNPDIFNLTDPWYLITARGNLQQDGHLNYHITDRHFTEQKVKVPNSVDISFGGDTTTTTIQPTTIPKGPHFPKDLACGKTKGCYSNCQTDGTCDWLVSWSKHDNETATIELMSIFSSDNKYVAVGFSERRGMFKASVLACRLQNGKVSSVASFNPNYYNTPLPNTAVDSSQGSFVSGVLTCSMLRNKTSDNPQVFNLTEPWYLITARGDLDNGALHQHDSQNRYVTDVKIDVMSSIQDIPFDQGHVSTLPTTPSAPAQSFSKDPECGKTKGCYSNCDGGVCNFLMSWKKEGDKFEISLKSGFDSKDSYVALGFGKSKEKMYPASVIQCVTTGGTIRSTLSYNPSYNNKVLPSNAQSFITQIKSSFQDGVLSCTLSRPIKSNLTEVYSMDQKWYLISARGNAPGGVLQQHDTKNRFFTSSQVDLNDMTVDISLEESSYPLIKAHGCLMILAWILSASIGIGMARYFKPVWPDTTICGVKVWFAIHRSAMVLTLCMGLSAFVIIFVQVKGYSEIIGEDYKKAHPILGIFVTALLVVNPFMSLLRCSPDHPQRPIFNWAHFIVGSSAHILSAVTIALGLYLPKAQTDGETGLIIIIIYGSWQVLFFCIMSAFDFIAKNDSKIPVLQQIQMTSKKKSYILEHDHSNISNINPATESYEQESKQATPMSSAKQWVMGFHVIVITTVAVYLMYMIIDTDV